MKPCPLPLVALRGDETCPRCGRPAREHRGHPTYQEETMDETTEPTREQIEEWLATHFAPASIDDERAVLRLALRTLDAEAKLAERERYIAEQRAITEPSVQDLARQIREANERAEKAERELADVSDECATLRTEYVRMRSALVSAEARAEKAERERDEARADLKHEREARGIVEQELRAARQERDEAEDEAAAHNAAATQYEKDIEGLRARLADADRKLAEALSANDRITAMVGEVGERFVGYSDPAQVVRILIDDYRAATLARTRLREALAEARTRLADAERRIAEVERERDDANAAFEGALAELSDALGRKFFTMISAIAYVRDAVRARDEARAKLADAERRIAELSPPTTDERLDCESSSLLLLSTWARRVMMRPKNRAKGVPSESVFTLLYMAREEIFEALDAFQENAPTDNVLAELGDAAAIISFAMREVESRRNR